VQSPSSETTLLVVAVVWRYRRVARHRLLVAAPTRAYVASRQCRYFLFSPWHTAERLPKHYKILIPTPMCRLQVALRIVSHAHKKGPTHIQALALKTTFTFASEFAAGGSRRFSALSRAAAAYSVSFRN
jgi:hypothetical protein